MATPPRLSRSRISRWGSALGHEDAFPRPRLSARCWFSQGTFAGTWGNGRDAPIPDLPTLTPEREVRPFPDGRLGAHEIGTPATPGPPGLSETMLCRRRAACSNMASTIGEPPVDGPGHRATDVTFSVDLVFDSKRQV